MISKVVDESNENRDIRFKDVGTIIVKVTHRCNLKCSYCHERLAPGDDMPLEVFKQLVDVVIAGSARQDIRFIFHGGEPSLMPLHWYIEGIHHAHRQADKWGKNIKFGMQTNGVKITDSLLQLYQTLGIFLSVSMDGPPHISTMRGDVQKVIANVHRLKAEGVHVGCIATINNSNYNHYYEIAAWLAEEMGIDRFKANVIVPVGQGSELSALYPEQIFTAYKGILDYMIDTDGENILESNLSLELRRFFDPQGERECSQEPVCRTRFCGSGKMVLAVGSNGDIHPCGRYPWDDTQYRLGSVCDPINKTTMTRFAENLDRYCSIFPEPLQDCHGCEAWNTCSFGCKAFMIRSQNQRNIDCIPTRMRFSYYQANRSRLGPTIKAIQNSGMIQ